MQVFTPQLVYLNSILMDAGGPVIAIAAFGVAGLIILPVIFIVEAIVMVLMKWGTFGRSLLDAVIMNVVSTLFGLIGVCGFLFNGPQLALPSGLAGGILFVLVTWAISVGIEGAVLSLLKRHPRRQTWLTALAANTTSYALLLVLVILVSQGTIGL
jgi:hypothetical protein